MKIVTIGISFVLGSLILHSHADGPSTEQPNIVFIYIDDMGYADPSCFGNSEVKTPRIDQLAKEGIRLTNFYSNSPICSPSRVASLTGMIPQRWGIHSYLAERKHNAERDMPDWLDPQAPTTPKLLKQVGYTTAHFGKWHLGGCRDIDDAPLPTEHGFDETFVSFEGLGDRVLDFDDKLSRMSRELGHGEIMEADKHEFTSIYVDKALDFIRRNKGHPFYLQVFPNDVHDPFKPTDEMIEPWKSMTGSPFEQKFFAVLTELDRQIGRLIDGIDEMGLGEKTLIVFTSDNGPTDWRSYYRKGYAPPGFTGPFFGRKWSLYEGGIRMPFIARWTGGIPAGVTDDQTVMAAIDLLPTYCAFAGVSPHDRIDGEDMSSVLLGAPAERRKPLCWEYGVKGSLLPGNPEHISPPLAMRDGAWKVLAQADGSGAKLFNLEADPGEKNDLAETHPERVQRMAQQVVNWYGGLVRQ